jgi:hypothetical protein
VVRSGTVVTIAGTSFNPLLASNQVMIGGRPVVVSSVNSAGTTMVVTIPTGVTSGLVTVTTPGGTATSTQGFTIVSPDFTVSALPDSAHNSSLWPRFLLSWPHRYEWVQYTYRTGCGESSGSE